MFSAFQELVTGLRESHERLSGRVSSLQAMDVTQPAYPSDWTIADTLSHLGSGAEITSLILRHAGGDGMEPAQADFVEIWDRWNGKKPSDQAADCIAVNGVLVKEVEALDPESRPSFKAYGSQMALTEFLAMRLDEHVIHTWDVETALGKSAKIDAARLPHLLGRLDKAAARSGIAQPEAWAMRIAVTEPRARFHVRFGDRTTLTVDEESGSPDLTVPAEAFVRLVFGRMDSSEISGRWSGETEAALSRLHTMFRGY
jgi:uncharacterized protein (TIGR03083 family)